MNNIKKQLLSYLGRYPVNILKILVVILVICEIPLIIDQFFIEISPWITLPAEVGIIISFITICYYTITPLNHVSRG
jgi:hypothetical protein